MQAQIELYKDVKRAPDGVLGIVSQCSVATKAMAPKTAVSHQCCKCTLF